MALVTGATGFIGMELVRTLLARGERVRCAVRNLERAQPLAEAGAEVALCRLDSADELAPLLAGVDVVYHLAAVTFAKWGNDVIGTNRALAAAIAEACARQANPPVVVFCSSIAAMGPAKRDRLLSEEDLPRPCSHYGRSKRASELQFARHAARVPTTILRPGMVFGARNTEMLPIFQTIAQARLHFVPVFDAPRVALIHVDDLIEIMIRASTHGKRLDPQLPEMGRGYYHVCDENCPSFRQLGNMIARAAGKQMPWSICLGEFLLALSSSVSEVIQRITGANVNFNIDKARDAVVASWASSPERVQRELGFSPPRPLHDRLRQTIDWYRKEGWI